MKQLRPYAKNLNVVLEKLMGGQKFTVNATTILLMAIVILMLCFLLEGNEKPKKVRVVSNADKND